MITSSLAFLACLVLGHREQATGDSGHQGSCDESCLRAVGFVQLLAATPPRPKMPAAKSMAFQRKVEWVWVVADFGDAETHLLKPPVRLQDDVEDRGRKILCVVHPSLLGFGKKQLHRILAPLAFKNFSPATPSWTHQPSNLPTSVK
jgi:hypothetical protein